MKKNLWSNVGLVLLGALAIVLLVTASLPGAGAGSKGSATYDGLRAIFTLALFLGLVLWEYLSACRVARALRLLRMTSVQRLVVAAALVVGALLLCHGFALAFRQGFPTWWIWFLGLAFAAYVEYHIFAPHETMDRPKDPKSG